MVGQETRASMVELTGTKSDVMDGGADRDPVVTHRPFVNRRVAPKTQVKEEAARGIEPRYGDLQEHRRPRALDCPTDTALTGTFAIAS